MIIARSVQVAAGPCLSFICLFRPCWVFTAAHVLSLVVARGGCPSLPPTGFSSQWLLSLRSAGSRAPGLQQLWLPGSRAWPRIVVVPGLSCPAASAAFPGQGSNLRPLHWQVGPCLCFPLKQVGHTVAHTCPAPPPTPFQLLLGSSASPLLIGACLDSPDSVDGIGGWGADTGFRL